LLRKKGDIAEFNNWETAYEMAFTIYLDVINLLLEILDAMGN
jgi:FtsH-binding integral membrane protein